jgi:hypothetical protein
MFEGERGVWGILAFYIYIDIYIVRRVKFETESASSALKALYKLVVLTQGTL